MTGVTSRLARLFALLGHVPLGLHQLLFRLAIAGVFLRAGLQKVSSWDATIALFRDEYRVPLLPPEIAATMSACVEVGCSLLLLIGLATRVATLPMLGMIATIQFFVYPQAWPEHLTWGSILVFLLTRGGGAISADHAIGALTARAEPRPAATTVTDAGWAGGA
jgi:putative oxidoreductase